MLRRNKKYKRERGNKKRKKVLTRGSRSDNITKLSQTTAWKHQAEYETSEKTLKKLKKGVDKVGEM